MSRNTPLEGLRIAVTRPRTVAKELLDSLHERGAEPIPLPTIEIRRARDLSALDVALRELHNYDWIIFTSANGVEITCRRMEEIDLDQRLLLQAKIAAIGPATRVALESHGLKAELVPSEYIAEGILDHLPAVAGLRILLPRARGARQVLPRGLAEQGARVDEISIYEAVTATPRPEDLTRLRSGLDAITFTSPSTVDGFIEIATRSGLDPHHLGSSFFTRDQSHLVSSNPPQVGEKLQQLAIGFSIRRRRV